jgi:MOSC domain-containing protein YiiM
LIGGKIGNLIGIAIKKYPHAPVIEKKNVLISPEFGVEGDHRGRPGNRQVTLLASESWREVCNELQKSLPWTGRRANLLVEGICLENRTGRFLRIAGVWLEITGETKPCHRMDEFYPGLRKRLEPNWRGGATCRVIKGGKIRLGDETELKSKPEF